MLDHPGYLASIRLRDEMLVSYGFDGAREFGLLASYMEMMNRGGSGGYRKRDIQAARANWGVDPLKPAHD